MRVQDVLKGKRDSEVISIGSADDVATAARLLMDHRIGGLPVVEPGGGVVGFLSERDVVRALDGRGGEIRQLPVTEVMARPAPACSVDDLLREVMSRMTGQRLRHLVVMDDGEMAGIISVGDLVKHRMQELETEAGVLRDVVVGLRARR